MNFRTLVLDKIAKTGWRKSTLASMTGIHKQNLGEMLKGNRPISLLQAHLLCSVLNINLDAGKAEWPMADASPPPA